MQKEPARRVAGESERRAQCLDQRPMTRKTGQTIDVARVVSTGQDRKTGDAIVRIRPEDGRMIALRLRSGQFRTLARGVLGLAMSRGDIDTL